MTTAGTLNDGSPTSYGFGVMIGEMAGRRKWSHAGTISGFRAQLAHYPDERLTIALLCNNGRAALEVIETRLARHVLAVPEPTVTEVAVSTDQLDRLVGNYRQDSTTLPVLRDDAGLRLADAPLRPVADRAFVLAADPDTRVTFDDEGLVVEREGQRTHAVRIVSPRA
jgi:hypothetical protein